MKRVVAAIEAGRCAMAVSGSLLNDAEIMLALKDRSAMPSMALSSKPVAPVTTITEGALSRTFSKDGVVVIVNPQPADMPGVQQLADILQRAPHKPLVIVAAQQFNPFAFGQAFRGLKVEHLKTRGKEMFKDLPIPMVVAPDDASETVRPKAAKASSGPDAPRFVFAGREDELEVLKGLLTAGGPIVVSGPAGIGKSLLVEHAIPASGLKRLPDMVLGWGTGADALFARLAEITKLGGSSVLADTLTVPHTPVLAVEKTLEALKAAEGTEGQVIVVHDLHAALGRSEDFFKKSRLEMLLQALLTNTYPLRIVFLSRSQPVFHRERMDADLRRVTLAGIKGRYFHELFEAYKVPEFPREKFGPLSDKIKGHPFAARAYAIEVRDRENGLSLLDDPKFLDLDSLDELTPLRKLLDRKVEKLHADEREALALAAHFRLPVSGQVLAEVGIGRKQRLQLLADGLLEMVGTTEEKKYCVHSLVRSTLTIRETTNFEVLTKVAEIYGRLARETEGVERLANLQEANRNAATARNRSVRVKVPYPDNDAVLELIAGAIRSKQPDFDFAARNIKDLLAEDPANSDAWILRLEAMSRSDAPKEKIQETIDEAIEKAPVPEVFHQIVGFFLSRKARGKATTVLEKAIEVLPNESRLRCRLAALLMRQGRRREAIDHLKVAMELDPMLPDAYGLLGTARRDEGLEALPEAEQLLREAVRLAPEDSTQISRLVDLLLARARIDADNAAKLREEAKELLDRVLRGERKTPDAHVLLASLIREEGGDIERAAWLLKKAKKLSDRPHDRDSRIVLEFALIDLRRGLVDDAEKAVRELAQKDPTNDRLFAALAQVLEAKQMFIPAHAEYIRAKDRSPMGSLERAFYDAQLLRLQAIIEAQVAGMAGDFAPPPMETMSAPASSGHQVVIRRRKGADGEEATEGSEEVEEEAAVQTAHFYDEPESETAADGPAVES